MTAHKFPNLGTQSSARETEVDKHVSGSYTIDSITLTLRDGTPVSVTDVMTKVVVYEDIFNPSITGFIEIDDYVGGLEKFQLTGGEGVSIRILRPNGYDILIDRNDLIVHSISNGVYAANNSIKYTLEFVSKGTIVSQKKRIYRSYGNNTSLSDIITDICTEDLGKSINIAKNLPKIDSTFISPGYSPLSAIQYLAKRCGVDGDYYLFFDRLTTGYTFASLKNLRNLAPKVSGGNTDDIYTIVYKPAMGYIENRGAETVMRAEYVNPEENFNHMINMNHGFYKSKVTNVNIARRSLEVDVFNYKDAPEDFYVNDIISDNNIFGKFSIDRIKGAEEIPGERMVTTAINDPIKNKKAWIKADLFGSFALSAMRVRVGVDGAVNQLGAGDIAYLKLPSDVEKTFETSASEITENNVYSGKYFVTAVRHVITNDVYSKDLELARGSVREPLKSQNQLSASDLLPVRTAEEGYTANAVAQVENNVVLVPSDYTIQIDPAVLQSIRSFSIDSLLSNSTIVGGLTEFTSNLTEFTSNQQTLIESQEQSRQEAERKLSNELARQREAAAATEFALRKELEGTYNNALSFAENKINAQQIAFEAGLTNISQSVLTVEQARIASEAALAKQLQDTAVTAKEQAEAAAAIALAEAKQIGSTFTQQQEEREQAWADRIKSIQEQNESARNALGNTFSTRLETQEKNVKEYATLIDRQKQSLEDLRTGVTTGIQSLTDGFTAGLQDFAKSYVPASITIAGLEKRLDQAESQYYAAPMDSTSETASTIDVETPEITVKVTEDDGKLTEEISAVDTRINSAISESITNFGKSGIKINLSNINIGGSG